MGVDGAGKTTQARLLVDELGALGVRVSRFHNPAGRRFMGRLADRTGHRSPAELLGRRGRLTVEVLIRAWRITVAVLTSRLLRRVAVMDRYACCQVALVHARRDPGARIVRRVMGLFPEADLVCFLAVDPLLAHARIHARAEDREELGDLVALDAAYRGLPEFGGFAVLDAAGTPDEVRDELHAVIAERLPTLGPETPPRGRRAFGGRRSRARVPAWGRGVRAGRARDRRVGPQGPGTGGSGAAS